jgi:Flp pilus assembly protein TadG
MRSTLRKLGREDGVEILEAALVLPLVFMFLLGIVWFGRAFNIYSTITQAAQQGAITAARPTCATCGNNFPTNTVVDDAIVAVMQASRLDPTQILSPTTPIPTACAGGGCTNTTHNIRVCRSVILNPPTGTSSPDQCGTTVSFQYPFRAYFPSTSLNLQTINLAGQGQNRTEN